MTNKSPETFQVLCDGVVEFGFIAQVSRHVHLDRTLIFRWLQQSEKDPEKFLVEWPVDSGEIFPLHEQIKRARALGRLGHDYFPDLEPTERDAVIRERMITSGIADESAPARVTTRKGLVGNGHVDIPNRRSPHYYEGSAKKAEAAIARRAEIDRQWKELVPEELETYEDNSDLLSDRTSDGLVTVSRDSAMATVDDDGPVPVTGRRVMPAVDVQQQVDLGRQRRAAAAAIPDEIVVQPSVPEDDAPDDRQEARAAQPLTPRQQSAAVARARIEARVSRGGAPMSEIERDLLTSLETPAGPQGPGAIVSAAARAAAPRPDPSSMMNDPTEHVTGRGGGPAPGGVKMR